MRRIKRSSRFKKDFKRIKAHPRHRKGIDELLTKTLAMLTTNTTLPESFRDHKLVGQWQGYRECHLKPDLLPIYRLSDDWEDNNYGPQLNLIRIGTHNELFD